LQGLDQLALPSEILIVKTTAAEELDAAYTRGNAIVLPASVVSAGANLKLMAHELFHVATRHDEALRDTLAPVVGFSPFDGVGYPPSLEPRRVTNPDAFTRRHAITVTEGMMSFDAVPIIQSEVPLDVIIGQSNPFGSFGIYLLEVDVVGATLVSDTPIPIGQTNYTALASINTSYTIHLEEILADNFAFLIVRRVSGTSSVSDPSILDQIETALGD
jgi:hypothetical protein